MRGPAIEWVDGGMSLFCCCAPRCRASTIGTYCPRVFVCTGCVVADPILYYFGYIIVSAPPPPRRWCVCFSRLLGALSETSDALS